jgi:hypothetical protein
MEYRNPVTQTALLLDHSWQPSQDVSVDAGFLYNKAAVVGDVKRYKL